MGRGKHRPMDKKKRDAKYAAHFAIAQKHKEENIAKMKKANPNWPEKKVKK